MDRFPITMEQFTGDHPRRTNSARRAFLLLAGTALVVTAGLLVYSQTMAFVWDEGFHLLAAQLIKAGKRPYIDFCFPQTPLSAYWNAAWMRVFGDSWRAVHVFSALFVAGATFLTADFVFRHFGMPSAQAFGSAVRDSARWRLACALAALFFVGLNTNVVLFATSGQAYGVCLFLIVAAFRMTVFAAGRERVFAAFAAGLLASAAAGCSLLTAPIVPVLLAWLAVYNLQGHRWHKFIAFAIATLIPFAPVFWLFAQGPRQVFFNIIQYQAIYRRVNWTGATPHDVDVLSAWLVSSQALLMGFLGIAGALSVLKKTNLSRTQRSELLACLWLAVALTVYIATAHPTFERYFLFVVPFLAILAAVGLYDIALRLMNPAQSRWLAAIVMTIAALALGRALFDDRESTTWYDYQQIAKKVSEVTPSNGRLYADELVYFLLHRTPPFGMEFSYTHKLELPAAQEKLYHIVSQRELENQVKTGKFDTVQSCNDDTIEKLKIDALITHQAEIGECSVYWGKVQPQAAASNKPQAAVATSKPRS